MKLVLGVDGGGSKTVAWIAKADDKNEIGAKTLGAGVSTSSNANTHGLAAAQDALLEAAQQAATRANVRLSQLSAACLGLAGAGREEQRLALESWARENLAARSIVVTDAALLLGDQNASVGLIAGTGSMAIARNSSGNITRCGGWGPLFGDAGGGFAVAIDALRAVAESMDGRRPPTQLWDAAKSFFAVSSQADLRHTLAQLTPAELAAFAPLVFASAEFDGVANKIIQHNAASLVELVASVCRRAEMASPIQLMYSGSLLIHQESYREQVFQAIQAEGVAVERCTLIAHPVQEAVRIALQLIDASVK